MLRLSSELISAELPAVPHLLDRAAHFTLGEALLAGGFVPLPTVVRMRDRVTPEGGVDVPVPIAD